MMASRHTRILRTIPCLIVVCLLALPAQAKYSGGTGEPNDPYQIATAADLVALGETPEDYDKHFILTGDIDLDPNLPGRKVFDKAVIAPDTNAVEDYFQGIPFTGVFDGNRHTISHLTIKGASYLGLFGQLGWWDTPVGEVKNLGVVDVNIAGLGSWIGGLVGLNRRGSATRCYSTGAVSGSEYVGGLVGCNGSWGTQDGAVTQCYSTGTASSRGEAAGGLIGQNWANVKQCYSTAAVSGGEAGGLVGCNWDGTVDECYSTGAVSGTNEWSEVGGLVGWNDAPVTRCFWDTQTSRQATSRDVGTGKTTAEMQTTTTFLVPLTSLCIDR
jgi:hypothetical protein